MIRLDNLNNHQVHQYARLLAAEAARHDGAPEVALMILADATIKVKGRRATGSWQFSNGIQEFDGTAAVVFADLSAKQPGLGCR